MENSDRVSALCSSRSDGYLTIDRSLSPRVSRNVHAVVESNSLGEMAESMDPRTVRGSGDRGGSQIGK